MTTTVVACVSCCPANPNHSTTAKPWHVKRSLSSPLVACWCGIWHKVRVILFNLSAITSCIFYMADSITQIKCLTPWFKRQSLASWTKMFHFTKVSVSAGNMSACVARDLGFTLKTVLDSYIFYSFFSVHSAPRCLIYACLYLDRLRHVRLFVFNSILNKHCDRYAFNLYEGSFPVPENTATPAACTATNEK